MLSYWKYRILGAFERFLSDERCFNNFFATATVSIDTDQRGSTIQADQCHGGVIRGNEPDGSLLCSRIPPATPLQIQKNVPKTAIDEPWVEIFNDVEYEQHATVKSEKSENTSDSQLPDMIDLVSDDEEAVKHAGNEQIQDGEHIAGGSGPMRQKRKHKSMKTNENAKKRKTIDAADADKRIKCEFCEFSTDVRSEIVIHNRTHIDERPHECEACGNRFKRKDHLKNHMNTHQGMLEV